MWLSYILTPISSLLTLTFDLFPGRDARHRRTAVRPHRELPARVRDGARHRTREAPARVHLQLPVQTRGARQGEMIQVCEEEESLILHCRVNSLEQIV